MKTIKFMLERLHAKMSDAEIGIEINAPAATVNRLRHGKHQSTSYERYAKIETLYLKREAR